jgi:two-component system sensor histidine kinase KdpD
MAEDSRPDPDALLAAIQRDEAETKRGKFKVFLGMAAGVGKTYSMLRAAQRAQREGVDVVVGYVETHGRKETDALLAGLPLIPRRKVDYRGVTLEEMDLDALLARRPKLALVDELAHTNAPGSRHAKRYQDVVELLDAGIDVFTSMNVQHAESRVDTVRQITGSTVQETVPDSLLDSAEMELIDLPPEDLLKRLDEGKVYLPERAELAMMNFFREGNLTALREMALRLAADHVGQDVHEYLQAMQISGPWQSGHRLLVAISASPFSQQMIRWTRRLADNFDCPWIAVYVEQPNVLAEADQARLTEHLALARELGAEVITTADADVARGILRVAHQQNVTQIVIGKPGSDHLIDWFRGGRLLRRLVRESGHIELHIVRPEHPEKVDPSSSRPVSLDSPLWQYGAALVMVGLCTLLNAILNSAVGPHALALVYLFGVVLLAFFVGRGPTFLTATASALIWDYFFLPPKGSFRLTHVEDIMMFAMYFVVALVLGQLVSRIRGQERAERRREERSTALYLLTRDLADAPNVDEMAQRLVRQVSQAFKGRAAILLREAGGGLAKEAHPASTLPVSEKEQSVAAWAFRFGKNAGRFTDNLPSAGAIYLPLQTSRGAVGVLGVELPGDKEPALEQRDLLEAFARQSALVLDRIRLDVEGQQSRLVAESEKLSKALLNSISHELRTPIAAITAAVSALTAMKPEAGPELQKTLTHEIEESAARLNRLVSNLLDMTRLESGAVKPRMDWCDVADLINIAMRHNERELSGHPIETVLSQPLPLVKMDFVLMEQVMNNLLLNAAAYTPKGNPVEIKAWATPSELAIAVADRGPGLPAESLSHLFEKFYRAPGAPAGGTGLGLSIVKGLVEAHGGRVEVQNRPGGGAEFTVYLPVEASPAPVLEAAI